MGCSLSGQSCLQKFVHISSRFYSAVVCGISQLFCGEIYNKFSRIPDHLPGMALWSYGNRYHGRIGAHRTGPGYRNNVIMALIVCCRNHYHRQRVEHVPRLPFYFAHSVFSSQLLFCCRVPIKAGISCFFLETTPGSRYPPSFSCTSKESSTSFPLPSP